MKFTLDTTEIGSLFAAEEWFLIIIAIGWIAREIFLRSHLKRLKMMDRMNKKLIMRLNPKVLPTQKEANKLFNEAFLSVDGAGLSDLMADRAIAATKTEQEPISRAKDILRELMGSQCREPGVVSGATVVIPNEQVRNFLAHIEIDGFSGEIEPGPMPDFTSVKVPCTGPDQMQPLTNSIATWEAMRKDAGNN